MILPVERVASAARVSIYQLKITLDDVQPPIWRRLQVPGDASLGWLHAVIQVAMGWTNSHLHQFIVGKETFSDPSIAHGDYEDSPIVLDEYQATLQQVAPKPKIVLRYEYDFGDDWQHVIAVEKILPQDPAAALVAQCLDGARACPPEDCGGTSGYSDLLQILADPKHEEHESMKDWLGKQFDPDTFDLNRINKYLRKLKWPRTTQSLLRRVLMQRDAVKE